MVPLAYAIGLTFGFFQMLYLDYKLDKNFKNQLQRIDKMNETADELHKRLESIRTRLQ